MEFITNNWETILCWVVFACIAIAIIILYRKDKITEQNMDDLIEYLDTLDDGYGVVALIAGYAKKAVMAVEQLVNAGIIPKTNEDRKNMAIQIVKELAEADGVELYEVDMTAVDSLIEAEVFEMNQNG